MASCEGLDAVLLAEGPEAAYFYRFYGERRHASLFEFARPRITGARLVSCYEGSAALAGPLGSAGSERARQAVPAGWARGRLGAARGALLALRLVSPSDATAQRLQASCEVRSGPQQPRRERDAPRRAC